jgi:LacI family transcriptional regulator
VALPHEQMGRRAVEILLAGQPSGQTLVPMPVVVRNSIGAPRP